MVSSPKMSFSTYSPLLHVRRQQHRASWVHQSTFAFVFVFSPGSSGTVHRHSQAPYPLVLMSWA